MADREKVIKALTECIFLHEHPDDDAGCLECPYRPDEKGTCTTMIPFLKDILELLKDQEANKVTVRPVVYADSPKAYEAYHSVSGGTTRPIANGDESYCCDVCGETVGWEELDVSGIDPVRYKYCPGCGRRVKWG